MTDFASFSATPESFGTRGAVITPGDTDLPASCKAVVCLTAGNITVVPFGNDNAETLSFVDVPAGFTPFYRVRRVTAATATVATIED